MKHNLFLALGVLVLSISIVGAELTIKVKDVQKAEGTIYVGIYGSEEAWAEHVPTHAVSAAAASPQTTMTIEVPAGIYAISIFQDLNGNSQMDYNAIRMPKEPWGVSNDARARFGPPVWKDMKFEVGEEAATAEITLQH